MKHSTNGKKENESIRQLAGKLASGSIIILFVGISAYAFLLITMICI